MSTQGPYRAAHVPPSNSEPAMKIGVSDFRTLQAVRRVQIQFPHDTTFAFACAMYAAKEAVWVYSEEGRTTPIRCRVSAITAYPYPILMLRVVC